MSFLKTLARWLGASLTSLKLLVFLLALTSVAANASAQQQVIITSNITIDPANSPGLVAMSNCTVTVFSSNYTEYRCYIIAPNGLWPQASDNVFIISPTPITNGVLPEGLYLSPAGVAIIPTTSLLTIQKKKKSRK
jgi:hypothetical protein